MTGGLFTWVSKTLGRLWQPREERSARDDGHLPGPAPAAGACASPEERRRIRDLHRTLAENLEARPEPARPRRPVLSDQDFIDPFHAVESGGIPGPFSAEEIICRQFCIPRTALDEIIAEGGCVHSCADETSSRPGAGTSDGSAVLARLGRLLDDGNFSGWLATHVERLMRQFGTTPPARKFLSLISTPDVFAWIRETARIHFPRALDTRRTAEEYRRTDGVLHCVVLVPASMPGSVVAVMGGKYTHFLQRILDRWHFHDEHLVIWILCVDAGSANIHSEIHPRMSAEAGALPAVIAIDLFSEEEKRQLNL